MEAGNCPCIKLVKVLLKKLQNDLFKVLYVPWITAYIFSGADQVRVQSTLTSVLARVVSASVPLTENDRSKAMERRRIRYKHNNY